MRTSNNQRRFAESDLTLVPVVPFLEGQFKSKRATLCTLHIVAVNGRNHESRRKYTNDGTTKGTVEI